MAPRSERVVPGEGPSRDIDRAYTPADDSEDADTGVDPMTQDRRPNQIRSQQPSQSEMSNR